VLRPEKDVAFVIHFDFEIELLQDVTGDRKLLEKALNDLQTATRQSRDQRPDQGGQPGQQAPYPYPTTPFPIPGGGRQRRTGPAGPPPGGGAGNRRFGIGTDLYDAILLASDEIMRKQQGRKALILLTDGVDAGSKTTLSAAIEAAQRADTLVYSVLFADSDAYGNRGIVSGRIGGGGRRGGMGPADGKKVLGQIALETGGRFFEVTRKQTLAMVYDAIDVDLRHQYSIGYTPDRGENPPSYHKIKLTAKQKGYTVQARQGYYGN
jgi:VWFA-related protein